MNGKAAKKLRRVFGTGAAYRRAKKDYDTVPTSMAQRTKPGEVRASKSRDPSPPSWPRTDDQKQQSRPLIVLHPRRRTSPGKLLQMQGRSSNTVAREAYGMVPKHLLDRVAIQHPMEVV